MYSQHNKINYLNLFQLIFHMNLKFSHSKIIWCTLSYQYTTIALNHTILFFLVLSLFTVVQFQNQGCAASTGDNGTCMTTAECSGRGGVASGPCANGYGVCCVCKLFHFQFGVPIYCKCGLCEFVLKLESRVKGGGQDLECCIVLHVGGEDGHAMVQAVSRRPLPWRTRFVPQSVSVGMVVDKFLLGHNFQATISIYTILKNWDQARLVNDKSN
jgi:hypothetical protein